jgi:hypothetical protein
VPPQVRVWHREWFAALHGNEVPPPQVPAASAAPQPEQVRLRTISFAAQTSAQAPSVV